MSAIYRTVRYNLFITVLNRACLHFLGGTVVCQTIGKKDRQGRKLNMTSNNDHLGVAGKKVTNWIGSKTCVPELYCEPETTKEIQQIVTAARRTGKKVRVIGCGHSYNDLAMTTDYMICLRRYNRLLSVDQSKQQVTVEGGVTMRQLNERILPEYGLAISAQGIVSDITLAGAIATGTHGTGGEYGSLSSMVVDMELLTASGEILKISKTSNADLFPAARLSLGVLGITLSVTLQCEPEFRLQQRKYPVEFKEVVEHLSVHVKASDHFSFSVVPYTDHVICSHSTRTEKEPTVMKFSLFWHAFVGGILFEFLHWLSFYAVFLVPWINWFYYSVLFSQKSDIVQRSDRVFSMDVPIHYAMEWAVPRDKAGTVLLELKTWIEANKVPAHFPIEIRFMKCDDIYLSPAYNTDVCFVNLNVYKPYGKSSDSDKDRYFNVFRTIAAEVGGRPHWGKVTDHDAYTYSELYPEWDTFKKIRTKLDPTGMFLNETLEGLFLDK